MSNATYTVKIRTISKETTAKEKVSLKDTSNASKLDEVVKDDGKIIINPNYYAILDIHNEKSDDKDYTQYIIVDKDGTKYYTGSESFFNSFLSIFDEMANTGEEYAIEVYKLPSKNYSGKKFLTCSIV